jgi:hypothetical protein
MKMVTFHCTERLERKKKYHRKDKMTSPKHFSIAVIAVILAVMAPSTFAAKDQTFTGKVSDAMCGAKHMMEGDAVSCLRACVSKGSKYALVVGDKVYTLDTSDKSTLATLDSLSDKLATVKGVADGDTITVSSVKAAMGAGIH